MKWETCKLGSIATCIQPGPFGSQLHNSDYSAEGTPIIMPKDMVNGRIVHSGLIRIGEDHVIRLNRHQVHQGNIMVARKGDVRKCVYITENEDGWMTGSDCLKVALDENRCFPKYIFYQLRSPHIGKWLETISIGATMPSINTGLLSGIEVSLPPIEAQIKIADILSAYDDLIENNQKQIKLLEEAAQRLYKEWFVDLRFPGYETAKIVDGVPEGWAYVKASDAIAFNPKTHLSKDRIKEFVPMSALSTTSTVLNRADFTETQANSGAKFKNNDTLLARITPCLENGKTAFVSGLRSDEGAIGSTEFIVMRSKMLNPYMTYLYATTDQFRQTAINSMTGSDGRQRAQVSKLEAIDFLLPRKELIDRFAFVVAPMFSKIYTLCNQNAGLSQSRDRLLPKLMSGELEV